MVEADFVYRAVVDYSERLLARERSYYWFADQKQWRKPLKLNEVAEEKSNAPFPVILVESLK